MASLEQLKRLTAHIEGLERLSPESAREGAAEHPNLPPDYWSFLQEIGFGNLEELQIYSGPVAATSIYRSREGLSPFLLFGDDFQGYTFGFDSRRSSDLVIEIDPRGSPAVLNVSFVDHIARYLARSS